MNDGLRRAHSLRPITYILYTLTCAPSAVVGQIGVFKQERCMAHRHLQEERR